MQQELVRTVAKWNTKSPSKGPSHKYLQPFAGRWRVEGHNAAGAPDAAKEAVRGIESYEWLEGEFFLLNRFDRTSATHHFMGMGWIGYDATNGAYLSYSISNLGYLRIYQVQITPGEICYLGTHERGVIRLSSDGNTITIKWEQVNAAGRWLPLCDLAGHRIN